MKRRPKVLFHASVGWMDLARLVLLWRLFSSGDLFRVFREVSDFSQAEREEYRVAIRKVVPLFLPSGARACLSSSTSGCDTKKSRTTFAPRDIFQLNLV